MANGGKVGREPTHIYCNAALLLLHILQFNTANYITYDFFEWDKKSWYLYLKHCYKTLLKIILDVTENINILMTDLFLKNT
jgi:hypothetical protein